MNIPRMDAKVYPPLKPPIYTPAEECANKSSLTNDQLHMAVVAWVMNASH